MYTTDVLVPFNLIVDTDMRSEERRVGKECYS